MFVDSRAASANRRAMQELPIRFFKYLPGLTSPIKSDLNTDLWVSRQTQDSIVVDEIRINALGSIDLAFRASASIAIDGRIQTTS